MGEHTVVLDILGELSEISLEVVGPSGHASGGLDSLEVLVQVNLTEVRKAKQTNPIYLVGKDVLALEQGESGVLLGEDTLASGESICGSSELLLELGVLDVADVGPEMLYR